MIYEKFVYWFVYCINKTVIIL